MYVGWLVHIITQLTRQNNRQDVYKATHVETLIITAQEINNSIVRMREVCSYSVV